MESPITFNIKVIADPLEKSKADLVLMLSLDVKEPSRVDCDKVAERLSRFRFAAPFGAVYFDDSKVLYVCIESFKGCEIEISISSVGAELQKRQAEKSQKDPTAPDDAEIP